MEKKTFFGKAGNNKLRALAIVPIALAVAFMLVVGPTLGQQQSADANKKITAADVAAAHDECPCKAAEKKITDALKLSGIDNMDFGDLPGIDPGTMCSFYSDQEAYQYIVANSALLGCGGSFSYVYIPGASGSSATPSPTQQGATQHGNGLLYSISIPTRVQKSILPSDITRISQQSGSWQWVQTGTESRTAEQVVTEANAIRAYWCQGTPVPPGTLDPGDWTFGQALAFCVGFTGAVLQIPMHIVNALAWSVGMRFCGDLMIYSWIDHQLQEAGYTDITALTIYNACFDYLTGQS